jgi:hypothetical protein
VHAEAGPSPGPSPCKQPHGEGRTAGLVCFGRCHTRRDAALPGPFPDVAGEFGERSAPGGHGDASAAFAQRVKSHLERHDVRLHRVKPPVALRIPMGVEARLWTAAASGGSPLSERRIHSLNTPAQRDTLAYDAGVAAATNPPLVVEGGPVVPARVGAVEPAVRVNYHTPVETRMERTCEAATDVHLQPILSHISRQDRHFSCREFRDRRRAPLTGQGPVRRG